MSGYKPIGIEELYSYFGAATTSTPTASPGGTITATYPPIVVPAGYMSRTGDWSSSLRLMIGGLMTATATVPTWQFACYASVATTSAPAFATSGITLFTSNTNTPAVTTANQPWDMDVHIGLRTLAPGAASTVACWGKITGLAWASPFQMTVPSTGAYTPPSTWDNTQAYVLWPALILGAGTAGNTVTVEYCKMYGES